MTPQPDATQALLPCPFCGAAGKHNEHEDVYTCSGLDCPASVYLPTAEAWNNRVPAAPRGMTEAESELLKSAHKECGMLKGELVAAQERIGELVSAIRWALGEVGEFPDCPATVTIKGNPKYWWRSELRKRAAILLPLPPDDNICDDCDGFGYVCPRCRASAEKEAQ